MTAAPVWFSDMPVLELRPNVPLRNAARPEAVDVTLIGGGTRWRLAFNGWQDIDDWRVNLDDDQGFAYALRVLVQHPDSPRPGDGDALRWEHLRGRHLRGESTDDDRVWLAQTLHKVIQSGDDNG